MVISSKFRPSVHLDHIKIGESNISPSETVRNLGVIMDSNYTMVSHINHKVQESFLKIRELSYYRRYLIDESSKTAVHAHVTSRLDYCNSLLYGLPKELSKKLQSVMNTAARLVTRTRKFDHITLWNQLPSHIRLSKSIDVFKRSLKTHLFKDAFNL